MYLTQSDIASLKLDVGRGTNFSEMMKDIISTAEKSDEKKAMIEGIKYFKLKNSILDKDFREYFIKGVKNINKNAANNHIVHAYSRLLVLQKGSYIASKPIVSSVEDEALQKIISPYFKNTFHKTSKKWITQTSVKGVEYLHPYINTLGKFDYVVIPGTEIIPVYDTRFQKELVQVIRYYKVEVQAKPSDPKTYRYKVEVWDREKVYFYEEKENGEYGVDSSQLKNPRFHFSVYNTLEPENKKGRSWGRVPFIPLKNNDESMTDLQMVKTLIDNYDYNVSDFSNKLQDIAKAVWLLKGYDGTNLSDFVKNLNEFNAVKVKELGGIDTKTIEIPREAHNSHLDRIEDNIYIFGMGVNPNTDKFGNSPSGIALKYFYAGLDLKSNLLITEMQDSLQQFSWFLQEYLRVDKQILSDHQEMTFTFNKSILVNEKELVEMSADSAGLISDETRLANHPWVNDVELEKKRIKAEAGEVDFGNEDEDEE